MKRKRIYTVVAKRWDNNPLWELAKLRAKELNISPLRAQKLILLQGELSKIQSI
jgi:hypothetical protein